MQRLDVDEQQDEGRTWMRPASAGFHPGILSCHRFIRCKKRKPGIGSWCWSYSFSHSLTHRSKDRNQGRHSSLKRKTCTVSDFQSQTCLVSLTFLCLFLHLHCFPFGPALTPASDFPGDSFLYTYFWQFFSCSSSSGVSLVSLLHSFLAVASQVSRVHRHSSDYLSYCCCPSSWLPVFIIPS